MIKAIWIRIKIFLGSCIKISKFWEQWSRHYLFLETEEHMSIFLFVFSLEPLTAVCYMEPNRKPSQGQSEKVTGKVTLTQPVIYKYAFTWSTIYHGRSLIPLPNFYCCHEYSCTKTMKMRGSLGGIRLRPW